jgi:hypothetical protein
MKTIFIIFSFALIFLSSCTKIIDIDLNDDDSKKLVVDAVFTTMPREHEVKLNVSANYFSGDIPPAATGATVSITDGVNTFVYTEVSPGVYRTNALAQATPNTLYTLNISYNGQDFSSTNFCDSVPDLDSVMVEPFYPPGASEPKYHIIRISTQEKLGYGDYYAWQVFVNGELKNDTITEQISTDDGFFPDGTYFNLFELTRMDDLESGDTVMIAQHAISKETYDAYFAILLQTEFRGGIFDTPPADVPTNLSEGAVGIFSATGESRRQTIVP